MLGRRKHVVPGRTLIRRAVQAPRGAHVGAVTLCRSSSSQLARQVNNTAVKVARMVTTASTALVALMVTTSPPVAPVPASARRTPG